MANRLDMRLQAGLHIQNSVAKINKDIAKLQGQLKHLKLNVGIDPSQFSAISKQIQKLQAPMLQNFDMTEVQQRMNDAIAKGVSNFEIYSNAMGEPIKQIDTYNKSVGESIKIIDQHGNTMIKYSKNTDKIASQTQKLSNFQNEMRLKFDKTFESFKNIDQIDFGRLTELNQQVKNLTIDGFTPENQKMIRNTFNEIEQGYKRIASSLTKTDQMKLFQLDMETKIKGLTGKYGTLVDTTKLRNLNLELSKLTTENFSPENQRRIKQMFNEIQTGAQHSSKAIRTAQQDARSFGAELLRAGTKFGQWMLIATLIMQPIRMLRQGIRDLVDIDNQLTQLRKVSGETLESMRGFSYIANDIAKSMGATTSAVIEATTEFARLGYTLEQASKLAEESILFSVVGNMSVQQASQTLMSTVKAFGIEVDEQGKNVRRVADAINEVNLLAS